MSKDLGKVVMASKGAYDATATYENLDTVTYEGSTYCCLQDGTTGHLPTETDYWFIMAKGAYKAAVSAGYTGTEEEFNAELLNYTQLSEKVGGFGLSVVDGKLCQTYTTE